MSSKNTRKEGFFFNSSFMYHIPTSVSPPFTPLCHFLLLSTSPPPQVLLLPFPSEKSRDNSGLLSTKHGITSYKKTRHKPLHQNWMRPPSRRKSCLKSRQKSQRLPTPTVRSPSGTPSNTTTAHMQRTQLRPRQAPCLQLCDPLGSYLVDSEGHVLEVSLTPLLLFFTPFPEYPHAKLCLVQ